MRPPDPPLREFGWNGLRFTAPGDWEVRGIGKRYLFLENAAGPVMEVKWATVRGRFSHDRYLRRLQRHGSAAAFSERRIPPRWASALGAFEARCFSWKGADRGGVGLTLFCRRCGRAFLVQFFQKGAFPGNAPLGTVLASFRDHGFEGGVLWSLYGVRALTPPGFRLSAYRLDAGAVELAFAVDGLKTTYHRWGPAGVLLRNGGLERFGRSVWRLPPEAPRPFDVGGVAGMRWCSGAAPGRASRLWDRLRPGWRHHCRLLWHVPEKNRILGITMRGRRAIDAEMALRLCAAYETR